MMDMILLFTTTRDELCSVCGDLIPIGEELVLEVPDDHTAIYFHLKCSSLCEPCIIALRQEEAEFREYEKARIQEVMKEHEPEDIHAGERKTDTAHEAD